MTEEKKEELVQITQEDFEEYKLMKRFFDRCGDDLYFWLYHLDEPVIFVRRDVKTFRGILRSIRFEVKEFEFLTDIKFTDYDVNKDIREVRLFKILPNTIMDIEFLKDRQESDRK